MTTPVDSIIVARLRRVYWPAKLFEIYKLDAVLCAPPIADYASMEDPRRRTNEFDLGRVHHFLLQLRKGEELDPIEVETTWAPRGFMPEPPIILDGHHRFAATVLARKRRMNVTFGGVIDQLDWLAGRRRSAPDGIYL